MPYVDPEKQKSYQREWMAKRRQEWLTANGPCIDCGSWENLQVDHVDSFQKVTHRVWSWNTLRREAELAKCVVRCQPCHAKKTFACNEGSRSAIARMKIGEANRRRVIPLATRKKHQQAALLQWEQAKKEGRNSLMRKQDLSK
jgi:hypothetical protein